MNHREILCIVLYLGVVAAVTSMAYRYTESDWIDYRRGQDLYERQKYSGAIKYLERARQAGLNHPDLIRQLTVSYYRTGHPEKAKRITTAYLSGTSSPQTIYRLATQLEAGGHLNEAQLAYAAILARDPDQRNVRIRLARVLAWTDHREEAVRQYRIALKEMKP